MKARSATPMVAALLGACLCSGALAAPISLSIIDTGGDLASVQTIIENYKKANPDKVSEIRIQRAPAPELPAKIKAQQDAGRLDINLVLTGQDGGALLAQNGQLIAIPDYQKNFPRDGLTDAGKALYDEGKGVLHSVSRQCRWTGADLQSGEGAEPAEDRAGIADLGEGEPGQVHVCASGEQRAGPRDPPGLCLHSRGLQAARPRKGLGQELGFPERARQVRRILSDRYRDHVEGVRPGAALDDRRDHGMGHEAARAERDPAERRRSQFWRTRRSWWTVTIGASRRACRRNRSMSSSTS